MAIDDELELQPSERDALTKVDAKQERKIMQRVYAAPDPHADHSILSPMTKLLLTVIVLGGLGYGGYLGYQKWFVPAPVVVVQPVDTKELAKKITPKLPGDEEHGVGTITGGQEAPAPTDKRAAIVAKMAQHQAKINAAIEQRDRTDREMQELVSGDKKLASKRAGLMSFVDRAYTDLNNADANYKKACDDREEIKRLMAASNQHMRRIYESKLQQCEVGIERFNVKVMAAEKYLAEKLTALDAAGGTKKRWIEEDLKDRRSLQIKIETLSEQTKAAKKDLSPQAQALAQKLEQQEKAIAQLQGKMGEYELQMDALSAIEPESPTE